jgi:7,8-dihydropterin-6-yl-methyl-4-(beta-D-ribofuranosyl)aminobenzene 5'-phosphate synthase
MKIVVLFENLAISKGYKHGHGLSLYIETAKHKMLFDTGTNGTFAVNAAKLGIEIADVDVAVISHGHYDHGGGLETFLRINQKAKIHLGKGAFEKHAMKTLGFLPMDIGLKRKLAGNDRFVFVGGKMVIDSELTVFNRVHGQELVPRGNHRLLKANAVGKLVPDDFEHEISLLVHEGEKTSLLCGCAHKGILNILARAKDITPGRLSTVAGGFHLMGMKEGNIRDHAFLDEFALSLSKADVGQFLTCHCTGEDKYDFLQKRLGNLGILKTGTILNV